MTCSGISPHDEFPKYLIVIISNNLGDRALLSLMNTYLGINYVLD